MTTPKGQPPYVCPDCGSTPINSARRRTDYFGIVHDAECHQFPCGKLLAVCNVWPNDTITPGPHWKGTCARNPAVPHPQPALPPRPKPVSMLEMLRERLYAKNVLPTETTEVELVPVPAVLAAHRATCPRCNPELRPENIFPGEELTEMEITETEENWL